MRVLCVAGLPVRVEEREMSYKVCFAIVREERVRTFGRRISLVLDALERIPLSFSTLEECRAWIRICRNRERRDDGGPPAIYTVEKLDSPRFRDAYKATFGTTGAARLLRERRALRKKVRLRLSKAAAKTN